MSERTARTLIDEAREAGLLVPLDHGEYQLNGAGEKHVREVISGVRFLLGQHLEEQYGSGPQSYGIMAKQTIVESGWFDFDSAEDVPDAAASLDGTPNEAASLISALNEET